MNGVVETYLSEKERVIHIHRFARRPLSLRVFVGAEVVASPPFTETVRGHGCGVRTGPLRSVDNFFPEEVEAICLGDERGQTIWTLRFDGQPVMCGCRRAPGSVLPSRATRRSVFRRETGELR